MKPSEQDQGLPTLMVSDHMCAHTHRDMHSAHTPRLLLSFLYKHLLHLPMLQTFLFSSPSVLSASAGSLPLYLANSI